MGGDEVRMAELLDLNSFIDTCELQEMRSIGPVGQTNLFGVESIELSQMCIGVINLISHKSNMKPTAYQIIHLFLFISHNLPPKQASNTVICGQTM